MGGRPFRALCSQLPPTTANIDGPLVLMRGTRQLRGHLVESFPFSSVVCPASHFSFSIEFFSA